jgi:hypothetical protein
VKRYLKIETYKRREEMTINNIIKIVSFCLVFCMIFNLPCPVFAGNYFISSTGSENNHEVSVGYKFKFGTQEKVVENNKIEKLKQEDTKGAGTAIGLIILGACIVAAAVLIVNKADDISDDAGDKIEELKDDAEQKYEEEQAKDQQEEQPVQTEEPAPEPAPEPTPEPAPEG